MPNYMPTGLDAFGSLYIHLCLPRVRDVNSKDFNGTESPC